ncbi:MAG: flagellin [Pseudomonadota bacterium]|nr:flagellin [Pseudomonadota bacterium]
MTVINTNIAAIKARGNLERVQRDMDISVARLSSGKRINAARDDAAGQAIASRMESQIRGLNINIRHAKDGQALVDTQEGAMQEITAMLQRMRELAVMAFNGTNTDTDRSYLNLEMQNLFTQIQHVSENTQFNDTNVLTGATFAFWTDIDMAGSEIITVAADMAPSALGVNNAMTASSISIGSDAKVTSLTGVVSAISIIDAAIVSVAAIRANLGAVSNRFNHIIDNLTNVVANTESAKSRVEDADFAVETTRLTRNQILQQAATSMLTQANAQKNTILALIQQ